jgi:hypothetical protein
MPSSRDKRNAQRRARYQRNAEKMRKDKRDRYHNRTEEQKKADAERVKLARAELRQKKIEAYLAEHGAAPQCQCGCGKPVEFNRFAKPNKFIFSHYAPEPGSGNAVQYDGHRIPTHKAKVALENLRKKNGWSIHEMARLGGVKRSTLWSILRDPNYAKDHGINAEMIRSLLRNLSGIKSTPT